MFTFQVTGSDPALFRLVVWFENYSYMSTFLTLASFFSALLCSCMSVIRNWHLYQQGLTLLMAVLRETSNWRSTETKPLLTRESGSVKNGILLRHAGKLYRSCLALICYLKADLVSRLSVWQLLLAPKENVPHNRDLELVHHHSTLGCCIYI